METSLAITENTPEREIWLSARGKNQTSINILPGREAHLTSMTFSPQIYNPSLIMRKHPPRTWQCFTKYLTSTLQKCPGSEKQGKTGELSPVEETKEIWGLNAMQCPGWDPRTRKKGHQWNSHQNLNKVCVLVNSVAPVLIFELWQMQRCYVRW